MRRFFSAALVALVIVVGVLKIAEWTCENWWMNSLGFGATQTQFWKWRLEAFVPAFLVWWLVMNSNARLAWHNARWRDVSLPLLGPRALAGRGVISPEDRARLDTLARRSEQAFVFLGALLCGVAAANRFDLWVLAFHSPTFGADSGSTETSFLVGQWPAMLWAWDAFGLLLLFTFGMVISIAAFEGVLDFDTRGMRVGDATARHFAFCTALLLVWIGVRCGLSLLGSPINFGWSPNGVSGFYERTFADPTRIFFLISCLPLSLWFTHTILKRATPALVVAFSWSLSAFLLPLIAPSFGRAVWAPSASLDATLHQELTRHIEVTRRAWGLDRVELRDLKVASSDFLLPIEATAQGEVLGSVVWPQEALRRALDQNDTGKGVSRYPGEVFFTRQGNDLNAQIIESNPETPKVTSPLALESDASRGGTVSATRYPLHAVVLQSPPILSISSNSPSSPPGPQSGASPTFLTHVRAVEPESKFGVPRTDLLTNLALALRLGDHSLLQGAGAVTWHLDPLDRVQTLAPFVMWTNAKPHPIWLENQENGRPTQHLSWLVEGCFTSHSFPGAAMLPSSYEWSNINYARQSVLGVCDAITGETQFYLFDLNEPFSRAWNALLPGFFRSANTLSAPLRAATRLSPALLNAQSILWTRYHPLPDKLDETLDWAKRKDEWRVLFLDSSATDEAVHPIITRRNGRPQLGLLAAFAPSEGTLLSTRDSTPLRALLNAQDEGEAIWKNAGRASFTQWLAPATVTLPLAADTMRDPLTSPYQSDIETFTKLALVPTLDARGDCVGLVVSRGESRSQKDSQWTLQTRIASTEVKSTRESSPTHPDANLARVRILWKSWKSARLAGRWARVEELERELNHLLAP